MFADTSPRYARLHVTLTLPCQRLLDPHLATRFARIAPDCARRGFVPCRSGFRTSGRSRSPKPHIVNRWRWRWRRVLMPSGTSRSSTRFLPGMRNETWRPIFRLSVRARAESGLRAPCRMMVDKLTAVPRRRLGRPVGSVAPEEVKALNCAIFVFLGLAETAASQD
jgi:PemK-like, MazF-like toxin of type II toxin-antitoxin system